MILGMAGLGWAWLGMANNIAGGINPHRLKKERKTEKMIAKLKVTCRGIRPLVMHNGEMADPENPLTKEIKDLTSKRSKDQTNDSRHNISWLEWKAGLYWDEKVGVYMPSDNIERCIQLGAQKQRLGKSCQAAVFVSDDIVQVKYDGPKTIEAMYKDKRFSLRKGVRIQQSRIIRVRPMIPTGWTITFTLEYDNSLIDEEKLIASLRDAGSLVGLGDWRPKFGRFLVEETK